MTLFLGVLTPVVVALIAASALFYSKWLDRKNEVEARHSEAREDAYDRLLAAGDAAWYYRTKKTVDPESVDSTLTARMVGAAIELFQNGLDRLKDHSRDYDAQLAALKSWYTVAFIGTHVGAKSFESARDGIINLRRREIGLRKRIDEFRELTFYERLLSGHTVQRLPEGINLLITTTDGEFIIQGSGEEFAQVLISMVNYRFELEESRERAWLRLAEWRDRKIWKASADQ